MFVIRFAAAVLVIVPAEPPMVLVLAIVVNDWSRPFRSSVPPSIVSACAVEAVFEIARARVFAAPEFSLSLPPLMKVGPLKAVKLRFS